MLLVVFPGEGFGSSPAESSSLSQSSLLLFYPDFNKMCLNPVWCWQYLIPSCWNVGSICLDRNYFLFFPPTSLFSLPFLCLISKSWHVEDVWANLISLLPSLGRTAEMEFLTPPSLPCCNLFWLKLHRALICIFIIPHTHKPSHNSATPERSGETGVLHQDFKVCRH